MLDEYGYSHRPRRFGIKVNITKCRDLWRKIRHPKKTDWGEKCREVRKRDAEFESWFSKPTDKRQP